MVSLMLAGPDLRRSPAAPLVPPLARSRVSAPRAVAPRAIPLRHALAPSSCPRPVAVGSSPTRRLSIQHVLLVAGLLVAALALAPEAPQDQAAICQRHNGPAACRVW
jgi:hypothetical protein